MKKSRPGASRMPDPPPPPAAELLLGAIKDEFESLSRQLKLIARYIEQHRDHIGLDRIQDVADRCGVQPSAVIRFAKDRKSVV